MPTALRRGLALVLVLGMAAWAGGAALAASGSVPFTDLAEVPWAVPGITALQEQGVLLGVAPGTFDPSAPLSRAQMATVLGRLLGWPSSASGAASMFHDAASIPSYALPYVVTASQDGILLGLPGGLFAPDVNVTWDQLAVIVARAYTYPQVLANQIPSLVSELPTGTHTPSWAIEAVAQDVQAGDFSGVLADLYKPGQPVTRAELAAFLLQVEESKGTGSTPVHGSVTAGQVTAVTGATLTIGNQSVPIAPSASVYVGAAASNLSAVQVGDTVSVVLSAGQAILINVTATPGGSSATSLSGTITSVGTTQLGLSVPGQTTVVLPLEPTVTVTVNGTASTLPALQAGQQATVSLDSSGNVASIAVTGTGTSASTVTGAVASVTATEIAVTPSGGSQQSYPLATGVTVNGLAGNLGSVTAGETVTLTLAGGQVTAIATGGALAVTTASLPAATAGAPYTEALAATGGTGSYTWTATASLPAGLTLSGAGILSGTPTAAGTYAIAVTVKDSAGAAASASVTLSVAAAGGAVTIATGTLPAATVNQAYTTTLAATGGTGTYTWTATASLPAGLTLSGGGILSGTPTTAGTYAIALTATDSAGAAASASLALTVAAAGGAVSIATGTLPAAAVNQAYTATLAATGGTGTYTWAATSALPAGLSLTATGVLTGTPTAAGTYAVAVTATDSAGAAASASLALTVAGAGGAVSIATGTLPVATVNRAYAATLVATGGTGTYTWTAASAVPAGLSLTASGVLSGTPTAPGTYAIAVTATDSAGAAASASLALTVAATGGTLAVSATALPGATVNQAYTTTLAATGGTGTYTWTATGTLPAGLSLTATGVLSGTPTAAGTYAIAVTVKDSAGAAASASLALTVAAAGGAVSIITSSLPAATVGQVYSATLQSAGGTGSVTWSYAGAMPPGLAVSSAGTLSGTPTATGSYTFSVVVTDSAGNMASHAETLAVTAAGGNIVVTTTNLPTATLNQAYSASLSAQGGTGGDSWTYSGPLPAGVDLMLNGQISGTPTTSGSFTFSVTVTDNSGSHASMTLTLQVQGGPAQSSSSPLGITTTSLPDATVGVKYATTLTATGGTGGDIWTFSGSLAPGLALSQSGVLSGTPQGAGTFYITAMVRDSANDTVTQSLKITVDTATSASTTTVTVTTTALPNATLNQPYSTTLLASGGSGGYTWVYTGSLPQGLSLSTSGDISGTPTASGTYTISVQAVNPATGSVSAAQQLTLTVAP